MAINISADLSSRPSVTRIPCHTTGQRIPENNGKVTIRGISIPGISYGGFLTLTSLMKAGRIRRRTGAPRGRERCACGARFSNRSYDAFGDQATDKILAAQRAILETFTNEREGK